MSPIKLRFDGVNNVSGENIIHFPKLSQGAPYSFGLRIRLEGEGEEAVYRDWDAISGMRWRIKLRPGDKHELMTLTKAAGNFVIDSASDTLTFVLKASDWAEVVLPQSNNVLEMDVPFAFVVEFLDAGGIVTERFAQGSGFITVNLDF
jgi:hypothetical protein